MNKNIERLIKEAGIGTLYEYDGYDGHAAVCNLADVEKLTELMIKEFRDIIKHRYFNTEYEHREPLCALESDVLKHFEG